MEEPDFSTTIIQLRAAQAGDRQVLDDLLRRYLPRIRKAVASRLVTAPHLASLVDDTVQEVLLAAFRGIDKYQPRSDATFMSWLARLVANKVCDRIRGANAHKPTGGHVCSLGDLTTESSNDLSVASPDSSVSQVVRRRELADAEARALAVLAPRYREVIVDRDLLGLRFEEIAQKLGYANAELARALHRRARKKLAKLMRPFDDHSGAAPASG